MHPFFTIAVIHFLAVASPGPDFAIVMKHGMSQSRSIVRWTAFGIATGILLHVSYCLLGIGLLISRSILLFSIIKWAGALYLFYLGWQALKSKPSDVTSEHIEKLSRAISPKHAFAAGFLCNALNPKATLFFLALFTQVIDPLTPLSLQIFYGLYMAIATYAWFTGLGTIMTMQWIRARLNIIHLWMEKIMGAALIALGLKVAMQTQEQ